MIFLLMLSFYAKTNYDVFKTTAFDDLTAMVDETELLVLFGDQCVLDQMPAGL